LIALIINAHPGVVGPRQRNPTGGHR
jgi:hypothetical protein